MSSQMAEELKEAGNRYFQQHKFDEAINAYNRLPLFI